MWRSLDKSNSRYLYEYAMIYVYIVSKWLWTGDDCQSSSHGAAKQVYKWWTFDTVSLGLYLCVEDLYCKVHKEKMHLLSLDMPFLPSPTLQACLLDIKGHCRGSPFLPHFYKHFKYSMFYIKMVSNVRLTVFM